MDRNTKAGTTPDLERLDKIFISDLLLRCIIGINPEERNKRQDVLLNVTLFADLSKAGQSDDIDDTINYKRIKTDVIEIVENSSYYLVERMAQRIADACLSVSGVEAVRVRVDKPGALRFARSVGVELIRFNE